MILSTVPFGNDAAVLLAFCHRCGKELPIGATFCPACGSPVPGATPAVGSPAGTTAQASPFVPTANYASLGDRFVAVLIDHIILFLVSLVFLVPLLILKALAVGFGFGLFFGPTILIDFLLWILYFTYFEGTTGQSFGKSFVGIKVVDQTSQRPVDMGRAFLRNLLRIVDWLPFFYLLGFVIIAVDDRKRRLGDMVADTIVVKAA